MTEPMPNLDEQPEVDVPTVDAHAAPDLAAEAAKLKDQLMRALAEAENVRRRAQKEREDTAKFAVSNFAKEMLNVADNFSRALGATPKDSQDPGLKNLLIGIEATERQLLAALERFGIKKIEPMGKPFDPNFHQVMAEIEDPHHPAGTIVQIFQPGYMIHDRLLREAMVGVAKAGPAAIKVDTTA